MARVYLLYLGQIRNLKRFKSLRAELEILQKKTPNLIFDWSSLNFDRSKKAEIVFFHSCNNLIQLYNNDQLWASLKQPKYIVLIMVCQQYKLEF